MIIYNKDEDDSLVIPCGLGPVVCYNGAGYNDEPVYYSLDYIAVRSVYENHMKAYAAYFTDITPDASVTMFEAKFKAPVVSYDPTEPTEEERDDSYFIFGCSNKINSAFRFGAWIGHNSDLHVDFGSNMARGVVYTDDEIHFTEGVTIRAWREGDTFTVEVNGDPETRRSAAVEDMENLNTIQLFGRKNIVNRIIHAAADTEIYYVKVYGQEGLMADYYPYLVDNPYDMINYRFMETIYSGDCITRKMRKPDIARDGYVNGELTCPQDQF